MGGSRITEVHEANSDGEVKEPLPDIENWHEYSSRWEKRVLARISARIDELLEQTKR